MNLSPGARLGSYQIIGLLGVGGMGKVFRARDLQLEREVAIKVLLDEAARNQDRLRRFITEAKAASSLNHPNILTIYGIGEEDENPYIITELIDGSTLRNILANGPLPVARAVDYASQAVAGLSKAHSIGIIHRDLKPENLMITRDGYIKILDFGLAKLMVENPGSGGSAIETIASGTQTGLILGSAPYMSPEQARGERADARCDIFSMGVILYEMITGENPFKRPNAAETISAILRDQPPSLKDVSPAGPPELAAIVDKALQKKAEDRYGSAREMETQLNNVRHKLKITGDSSTRAFSDPVGVRTTARFAPRSPSWKALIPTVGILLIVAIVALFREFRPESTAIPSGPPVVAVMAIENKTTDADLKASDVGRILSDAFVQILYDCQGVQVVSPVRIASIVSGLGHSFADTARDLNLAQKICNTAKANTILAGSLSQIGRTYILTATLTQMPTGKLIGSFRAESEGKDQLLESLTSGISDTLKSTLASAGHTTMAGGRNIGQIATNSVEAYAHFVKASDLLNEGNWNPSIEEAKKALEIDPNMGVAWSVLACAYSFAGDDPHSIAAQQKALELKPRMSRKEQIWVDGTSAWLMGSGKGYRESMEKYVRTFPDDRDGYFYVGLGWQWLDRNCAEALKWYQKAYELTPNYYPVTKGIVDCYMELKQNDEAVAALQKYLLIARSGHGHDEATWQLTKLKPK